MGPFIGYNPFADTPPSLDLITPLRKDTVYVPSMGYAVLRVRLDNPGLWLFHCHVLWHQAIGMGMVVQIGDAPQGAKDAAKASCG